MEYRVEKLSIKQVNESKDLLTRGFNRSVSFWSKSLENFIKYLEHKGLDQIGYGLYSNKTLCGIVLVLPSEKEDFVSISSLFVLKNHRSYSLSFIKKVLDNYKHKTILDFTATKDVQKILKAFKFKQIRKNAFLRIPIPTLDAFKIKKLSSNEANNFCYQKNIFYSPYMRILVLKHKERESFAIYKDLSITKNNLFRNLSILVSSSNLNDKDINAFAFYNALRFRICTDFILSQSNKYLKFKRFSVIASKDTSCDYIGNSELSLFNF